MKMIPMMNHGVGCMSIGFLIDKDAPVVWRGPMVSFYFPVPLLNVFCMHNDSCIGHLCLRSRFEKYCARKANR